MKAFKLFFVFSIFSAALFTSCGDSNDCNTTFTLGTEIQAELDAVTAAATTYSTDPTTENCNSYKTALQAYVNAIASFEDCAQDAGQLAEFQASLDSAQQSVDSVQC